MTNLQSISEAVRETAPRYFIRSAALFGSYARVESRSNSDVDILIETDASFSLLDAARFRRELSDALNVEVDIVSKRSLEGAFAHNALNDQVMLYERA